MYFCNTFTAFAKNSTTIQIDFCILHELQTFNKLVLTKMLNICVKTTFTLKIQYASTDITQAIV